MVVFTVAILGKGGWSAYVTIVTFWGGDAGRGWGGSADFGWCSLFKSLDGDGAPVASLAPLGSPVPGCVSRRLSRRVPPFGILPSRRVPRGARDQVEFGVFAPLNVPVGTLRGWRREIDSSLR
jgi:hypothetical protein